MARFGKRDADAETGGEPELEPELEAEPEAGAEGAAMGTVLPATVAPVPVAAAPLISTSVVFQPEPLGDDAEEALGVDQIGPGADPALATAAELPWVVTARTAPVANVTRTALQEKMAEIAKKHKDGPIEHMTAPIREALAAHGREVPDDWILAIAEGLRQHGPISLNPGGPGSAAS